MTAFFDVKLLFATPQSFHDSSLKGALKASPPWERWHEVTEWRQKDVVVPSPMK